MNPFFRKIYAPPRFSGGLPLKIIALVLMFGEHFGLYLGGLLPERVPLYLTYAGRTVAPLFFFLAVGSYFKTSNRRRYITRLFTWAVIMQVGNFVISRIVQAVYQPGDPFFPLEQNIFLTIAVGVSMVAAFEWARAQTGSKKWLGFGLAGLLAFASLFVESSYYGLGMFLIFYFFYHKKPAMYFAYAGFSLLLLLWGLIGNPQYFWEFEYQWMMIAALPFMMLYNGERGKHSLKYLFYAFYPLHIWILYVVQHALGVN